MYQEIKQIMTAGQQFTEATPSPPENVEELGNRKVHYDLTVGGKFFFDRNEIVVGRKILLNLAEATSWTVELHSVDIRGNTTVHVLYDDTDFTDTDVAIFGENLFILGPDDFIAINSVGATSSISAQISVSRW